MADKPDVTDDTPEEAVSEDGLEDVEVSDEQTDDVSGGLTRGLNPQPLPPG